MCGITGVFLCHDRSVPDRALLAESVRQLRHRGPDADSFVTGPGFGLGHARLSRILDFHQAIRSALEFRKFEFTAGPGKVHGNVSTGFEAFD